MKPTRLLAQGVESLGYRIRRIEDDDPVRKLARGQLPEFRRLARDPSTHLKTTDLLGHTLQYFGGGVLCRLIAEIWCREIYAFPTSSAAPRVLDCGANIGVATLYVKQRCPQARVTAFEASPEVCAALRHNVASFGHADVEVVNAAVWTEKGELSFSTDPESTGGRIGGAETGSGEKPRTVTVPTVALDAYLDEPIDLLKIDIEGAETAVIEHLGDRLRNVRSLFVEYHSEPGTAQSLDRILEAISAAGLRYYIEGCGPISPRPFESLRVHKGFDGLLNIFASRTEQ